MARSPYGSLEDFLVANTLTVDGVLNDGWGALFPVKGREIDATILFADISSFSKRTLELSPSETLIFVNNFLCWIWAEALRDRPGIIDKYIGDEVMVVFSREFGSNEPFVDAVQTARWMAEHDALDYRPHMGIASGRVIVGYTGTPLRYQCSVFGVPVALASRCAAAGAPKKIPIPSMVFSAEEWRDRKFEDVFLPETITFPDGATTVQPVGWEMMPSVKVQPKNLPELEIIEIRSKIFRHMNFSLEDRCRESLQSLSDQGRYWPAPTPSTESAG